MTVEMFIRILGYILYVALWSPVIVLLLLAMPIAYLVLFKRMGFSIKDALGIYLDALKANIQHDIIFIKTGVWY